MFDTDNVKEAFGKFLMACDFGYLYYVVRMGSAEELSAVVSRIIKETSYLPQGGVSIDAERLTYAQSVMAPAIKTR